MVSLEDTVHARIKRVIIDSGTTIKQFVHNSCESALTAAEKTVATAKASTEKARKKSK
jgi:hypothetical protein